MTYRVTDDPTELLDKELGLGDQVFGMGNKAEQIIILRPGMAPGFARQILIHEIIHQLFDVSGLQLEKDVEEQVCLSIQSPMLGVLRDNPDLVAWLSSED